VFVVCGSLGLWSGFAMAWFGEGTPFPTDTARRLVVRGPYAVVRNPMAITGLGQGFAMGVAWGSWSMLAVTFAGGLIWQVFVRPREEADLEQRLGDEYRRYRAAIDCWIPSRRVYDRT
jgi:protein-S-isoprenylcysteine O-methyltransferase Ste14